MGSIVTIPGNTYPWNPGDTYNPFSGANGATAVTVACTPGQRVSLIYLRGLVVETVGAPHGTAGSYTPIGQGYNTGGGIQVRPSDRIPGEFNVGSDVEFCGAYANTSGAVVGYPMDFSACATGALLLTVAPAGTSQLLMGVNRYEDWSYLSGSWSILTFAASSVTGVIAEPQIDAYPPGVNNEFVRFRLRGAGSNPQFSGYTVLITGTLDSGSIAQTLIPNTAITPSGSFYTIELWSNGRIVSSANVTISTSGDLSTLL